MDQRIAGSEKDLDRKIWDRNMKTIRYGNQIHWLIFLSKIFLSNSYDMTIAFPIEEPSRSKTITTRRGNCVCWPGYSRTWPSTNSVPPKRLSIVVGMLEDGLDAAEIGPVSIISDHADHVSDRGRPLGNQG